MTETDVVKVVAPQPFKPEETAFHLEDLLLPMLKEQYGLQEIHYTRHLHDITETILAEAVATYPQMNDYRDEVGRIAEFRTKHGETGNPFNDLRLIDAVLRAKNEYAEAAEALEIDNPQDYMIAELRVALGFRTLTQKIRDNEKLFDDEHSASAFVQSCVDACLFLQDHTVRGNSRSLVVDQKQLLKELCETVPPEHRSIFQEALTSSLLEKIDSFDREYVPVIPDSDGKLYMHWSWVQGRKETSNNRFEELRWEESQNSEIAHVLKYQERNHYPEASALLATRRGNDGSLELCDGGVFSSQVHGKLKEQINLVIVSWKKLNPGSRYQSGVSFVDHVWVPVFQKKYENRPGDHLGNEEKAYNKWREIDPKGFLIHSCLPQIDALGVISMIDVKEIENSYAGYSHMSSMNLFKPENRQMFLELFADLAPIISKLSGAMSFSDFIEQNRGYFFQVTDGHITGVKMFDPGMCETDKNTEPSETYLGKAGENKGFFGWLPQFRWNPFGSKSLHRTMELTDTVLQQVIEHNEELTSLWGRQSDLSYGDWTHFSRLLLDEYKQIGATLETSESYGNDNELVRTAENPEALQAFVQTLCDSNVITLDMMNRLIEATPHKQIEELSNADWRYELYMFKAPSLNPRP